MGNKLSCNCGPLSRKPYRYEDTPWSAGSSSRSFNKRDGHLLRLWAEVFHVSSAGGGTVKWQQVSEDLVPVNITCVQDSPDVVFHITAYNSQVDKILDVRLVQPGTRIGQASECFVYWKDPVTSDTWGLNFTSPIDAKQFRECCVRQLQNFNKSNTVFLLIKSPAFKFSRKASSSYSLRLDNTTTGRGGGAVGAGGTGRGFERGGASAGGSRGGSGRVNATSGTAGRRRPLSTPTSPSKGREPQCTCMTAEQYARLRAMDPRFRAASTLPTRSTLTGGPGGRKDGTTEYTTLRRNTETKGTGTSSDVEDSRAEAQRGRSLGRSGREIVASKSVDYSDGDPARESTIDRKKSRSKSTDDVNRVTTTTGKQVVSQQQQTELLTHQQPQYTNTSRARALASKATIGTNTTPTGDGLTDSQTLKRLLKPIPVSTGSVVTSPEMTRRVYYHDGYISEPEIRHASTLTRDAQTGKRTDTLRRAQERSRGVGTQTAYGKKSELASIEHRHYHHPAFDHAYYATTPPSSSPEGDVPKSPSPGSPTARLLLEYEQHLRNTLAKGMDAESYSLHTFEAIISQSNENLVLGASFAVTRRDFSEFCLWYLEYNLPSEIYVKPNATPRRRIKSKYDLTPYSNRVPSATIRPTAVPPNSRSTTLPRFVPSTRDNFRVSSREASRDSRDSDGLSGYYSDFRDRGYLSDHNSRSSGPYDRQEVGSLTKSGYFSDRENRSGYFSDREVHLQHKFGSVRQQASVESADSRLCYLTSSEATFTVEVEPFQNRGRACPRPNKTSPSISLLQGQQPRIPGTSGLVRGQTSLSLIQQRHNLPALRSQQESSNVVYATPGRRGGGPSGPIPRHPQQHLLRGPLRPQLQHYDSIQELYSFVSNVLSSWENRGGGGDDASSTASGIGLPTINGRGGGSIPSGNSSVAGSTISSIGGGRGVCSGRGQQEESTYYATLTHYNLTGGSRQPVQNSSYPCNTVPHIPGGLGRGAFTPVVRCRHPETSISSVIGGNGVGSGGQYYTAAIPAAGSNNTYFYQQSVCQGTSGQGQLQEEPVSRPVSNLSNKSSEQYFTYPYPRKQQELILRSPDWATVINWARRVVQSREDENVTRSDCSHEFHDVRGLKKHEHTHSWPHVQPQECNVLFLAKISDDERMSLTTAVSDDEPGDGTNSPKGSRKSAASFNCTGAVRKAGFLSVKKWLLRKRHQVELARRRGWKGYWVCLKGTTLLFYPCDARESRSVEAAPKHLIIVDGAIMQPIPEHPKRDYIFCLSTAFGDAYLFQAPCQVELESWVHSIHWACAAAFARHRGKTGTLHLLQEEIIRLDKAIESDGKLRHMAELQRSVVADPETRQQLAQQIGNWEENIERLHCEQFRLRCYMASLQGGELPNPKSLLSHVSRTTKNTLNRLGVFTVSSFHAFVCARSPSLLSNLLAGRGATKRRAPLLSRSNSASSRRSLHASTSTEREAERTTKISLPENQVVTVPLKDAMSVEEFLVSACARKNLGPMEHFVRVKKRRELPDTNYFVPHRSDLIDTYLSTHEVVEVRSKLLYQVELGRASLDQMWGFSVEAELVENSDRQDELCCYVSRVEERSVAMNNGIIKGDEILVINGSIVSDLDMMYIESVLQEELSLCLMLRSARTEPPSLAAALAAADAAIAQLVCPPPPADPIVLTDDVLSHLIVPAPHENRDLSPSDTEDPGHPSSSEHGGQSSRGDSNEIETLLMSAEQVTGICRTRERQTRLTRQQSQGLECSPVISGGNSPTHPYGGPRDVEKMKKVVLELVETEKAYVKHLTCLLEQYLEPLRQENFLSADEMIAIFGNIREMVTVQRRFLRSLETSIESDTPIPLESINHPSEFKTILANIAAAFLSFADHFKLYSSFCASHSKAQKLLHPLEGNQALQQFLAARNPRMQHSNTLESYLIKPIQRILTYPLLLQHLLSLVDTNTPEYQSLLDARQSMQGVAGHINEMQRIHEEYGAIFEHLFRQHQKTYKVEVDLSPGDLFHYGGVEWLNIADFLGKIKKGLELHATCFVFRTAVVFLCKERLRHKKKLMSGTSKVADKSEVEIIRYQVLIPVSEVQVRQVGDPRNVETDANGVNFSWELIHLRNQAQRRSEKIYLLSNSTAELRNPFLKNIRHIIRDSVRNMSLPSKQTDSGGESSGHSHYAVPEGCDLSDRPSLPPHRQAYTLGRKKPPKPPQRHSAGNLETGSARLRSQESSDSSSAGFRMRSGKLIREDSEGGSTDPNRDRESSGTSGGLPITGRTITSGSTTMPRMKGMLGNTPNHLTLSTTSTLSAGSTGSAAKLIQSSSTPGKFPSVPPPPEPSSPVWKPRDEPTFPTSTTLPRKIDSQSLSSTQSDQSGHPHQSTSSAKPGPSMTLPRHK